MINLELKVLYHHLYVLLVATSIIVARAFDISDGSLLVACYSLSLFFSFHCYQTCSHVLLLPNGENPVASWPNSIPLDGSKIDTDPHTFGCREFKAQSHIIYYLADVRI